MPEVILPEEETTQGFERSVLPSLEARVVQKHLVTLAQEPVLLWVEELHLLELEQEDLILEV